MREGLVLQLLLGNQFQLGLAFMPLLGYLTCLNLSIGFRDQRDH